MGNDSGPSQSAGDTAGTTAARYYLLKAEPDSRIEKGKDVKFSVDDFEEVKTSPWEGVRNYEARNIMKEMKVGDKALFYHSNCKEPGIAAFAEVSKEAYPDYTAWDSEHPYYDAKSDKTNPKWYMVDLTFTSRAAHFVPLALLRYIASVPLPKSGDTVPGLIPELSYLPRASVLALQGMGLVTRGRLSVQRVKQEEWDAINLLAEQGGWEGLDLKKLGSGASSAVAAKSKAKLNAKVPPTKGRGKKRAKAGDDEEEEDREEDVNGEEGEAGQAAKRGKAAVATGKRSRAAEVPPAEEAGTDLGEDVAAVEEGTRRSSRRIASKGAESTPQPSKSKKRKVKG
ncbi:PUA-like domain-containing protein [Ephemerocybe angulata]|uniref:PUA-like domain-containing protein n=1 Tax=Ephemerocybe angulata TaxID=980116 RepID=A0A8H6HM74_9AGAR|nr:PUA-like domain-containing protein [Tulosesus angulatus]